MTDNYILASEAISLLEDDLNFYNEMVLWDVIRPTLLWNATDKAYEYYVKASEVVIARDFTRQEYDAIQQLRKTA